MRTRVGWASPAGRSHHGALHARVVGGGGDSVVLLHGLAASNRYWGAKFDALAEGGLLVVPISSPSDHHPDPPSTTGRTTTPTPLPPPSSSLSAAAIGVAILGYGIPGFLFGPVIGRLADRHGRSRLIPLGLATAALAAALLALPVSLVIAAATVALLSLGYDLTQPLLGGIVTQLPANRGQAMALNVFTLFIGTGLGHCCSKPFSPPRSPPRS